ncbi:MAG: orotidine-5'-phosphate decarboxylase [Eubacteriaceae bacterium]|nr:orotidine-5'-phosphate decarboxylase [Eubacteriaceae bacterium]
MIIDILYERAVRNYGVCVGLDTSYDYLPSYIKDKDAPIAEKIFEFNKAIIDATASQVACYKVQSAYYEALGLQGMKAFSDTLAYIREAGEIVISDVKRSDIAQTAQQYANAHFSGDFESDCITISPYMGYDTLEPFEKYLNEGKVLFLLIKTSNASSADIQDLELATGELVYERVARITSEWGEKFIGANGFSALGAVIGLTYPKDFYNVKEMMKNSFFLIPGYGAQGGTGEDLAEVFKDGICGVVNSSRGIIARHLKSGIDKGFEAEALKGVIEMKEDISRWL